MAYKLDFYPEEWRNFIRECDFTELELNIIDLTRKGWYIADIAQELFVSERTVKRRRKSIADKIQHYIIFSKTSKC